MNQISTLLTQLGVDHTFFIMFVLFAATYAVVSTLLTRPMGALVREREKRSFGRQEEVSQIRVELTDIQGKLSDERRRAQNEANQKFSELRAEGVTEQRKILAQAREDFAKQVKATRDSVENMLKEERQKVDRMSNELKEDVVGKLLGSSGAKSMSFRKEV